MTTNEYSSPLQTILPLVAVGSSDVKVSRRERKREILRFKQFTGYGQARKYLTNYLSELPFGTRIEDKDIIELMRHHPRKNIDTIHSLEWKSYRRGERLVHGALYFRRTADGEEDDISYVSCLKNLFGLKDRPDRVQEAFHDAIFDTPKKTAFYNSHHGEPCNECGKATGTGPDVVDHFRLSFREIVERFLATKQKYRNEIDVFERLDKLYDFRDQALKQEWIAFHDSVATYRLLCGKCNSSMGSYGYRRKKTQ